MKHVLNKVPEITACFWLTKILTTGMGESLSDYLVHNMGPVIAVTIGGIFLLAMLVLQIRARQYEVWPYWLTVTAVSIFGTMGADFLHHFLGLSFITTTSLFIVSQTAVFIAWYYFEKTLSIHSIYTFRREVFYWATVMGTFMLGTATGDMTASSMHLGFFTSGLLFTGLIVVPAIAYWLFGLNDIFAFWFAYIMTRPLGASFADWLGKPSAHSGVGLGDGTVSLGLTILILVLVTYQATTYKGRKENMNYAEEVS